ncbi:hypothetical protein J6Z48_01945 [bacterium]|nr:hypothetical protein [bacterium]
MEGLLEEKEVGVETSSRIILLSLLDFLKWWYQKMPIWHLRKLDRISTVMDDTLSISLLVRNFFVPWHRDYSLMGFGFGIVMKLLYLPIALALYLLATLFYFALIIIWLLLPIGAVAFILYTFLKF